VVLNEGLTATHGTTAASTVSLPLRTALDQTFSSNGGLNLNGAIDLDGKMVDFTKTTATGNMIVNGVISGQGRLTKRGDGDLFLNAANTYSASTFIEEGLIDIQTSTSLGTSLAQVRPGASLLINSNGSINPVNTLALEGTLVSSGAAASHSWQGTVILVGPTPVIQVGTPLTLSGMILDSANGGFTKTGTGTLRLSGNTANNFDGGLTINQGVVELAKTAGVVALPGPVTVGDGTGTDTLRLINADQIADMATVHLNRGVFDLNSHSETIATLDATGGTVQVGSSAFLRVETGLTTQASAVPTTITGWVRCGSDMTWTIADGPASDDLVVNAMFDAGSPSVTLRKEGPGRMVIAGTTVVPTIFAAAGTVRFTGIGTTQFNLDGGTLDGTGFTGRIVSSAGGGTAAPGLSPGRLTCTQTAWNGQTTFAAELLSSITAGTTYDQLTVNGPVNLGGASLQVIPLAGFTGSIGDTFMIIDNDAADAVTGTFAGLPAGAVVTAGVFAFSISYTGGTGNDVVLTRVVPPIAPNLTSMTLSPGTGPGGQDVVTIGGTFAPLAVVTLQASTDFVSWTDVQSIAADASGVVSFTVNQTPGIVRRVFRIKP
jgi:autotransporter-associated beta strand protein